MIEGILIGLNTALSLKNILMVMIGCFAGTIIGMFSSLMVKAYYSGRNVISFQPNKIKNMDFLSQRNLIKLVKNVDELKKNIFDGCIVIPRTNPFKDSVKRLGNYLEKELIQ